MRKHLLVGMIVAWAGAADAGPKKPLLAGVYEVATIKLKGAKEVAYSDFMIQQMQVLWGRNVFVFDGASLTIVSQLLDHDERKHLVACEAQATGAIVWTAKGFSVPTKFGSQSKLRTFTTLTTSDDNSYEYHCGVSLNALSFVVKPGDVPVLTMSDGTVFTLSKSKLDVDWSKHAPSNP
jgi:hypothetical protein